MAEQSELIEYPRNEELKKADGIEIKQLQKTLYMESRVLEKKMIELKWGREDITETKMGRDFFTETKEWKIKEDGDERDINKNVMTDHRSHL